MKQKNAIQYTTHISNISKLANVGSYEAEQLFKRLRRYEAKAHRIAEAECNGIDKDFEPQLNRIKENVLQMFGGKLDGFFINGDPRGYALKIQSESQLALRDKGIDLYRDWGGYGILAPEF